MAIAAAAVIVPLGVLFFVYGLIVNLIRLQLLAEWRAWYGSVECNFNCKALTTSVAICRGAADLLFSMCLGFSLIVMYDAIGVRQHAGMQAERVVHVSVYDQNIDDQVRPTLVSDEVITRTEPEKYWAPHPKTGVFGPADEQNPGAASGLEPAATNASSGSVLEEKAFFRPLENLEKPAHP